VKGGKVERKDVIAVKDIIRRVTEKESNKEQNKKEQSEVLSSYLLHRASVSNAAHA
jgi:hypothetical protein